MKVVFFHRRPFRTRNFSIERFFSDIRASLPPDIEWRVAECHCHSVGLWNRLFNIIEASFRQGDINHVTGDVHYLTVFLSRKRTILSIMDCIMLERLKGVKWKIGFFIWYWLPIKRSQVVTVISYSTKAQLLRFVKVPEEKIRVIHCPVSKCFQFAPKQFEANRPTMLQFNTGKHKNLVRIAEALEGISCRLRIIGILDQEERALLTRFRIDYSNVSDLSDIQLLGEYIDCDMLLFASTYEGFGLPILEAQSIGRPVITSSILSMPEVAGGGACLVDPNDIQSIRRGILNVVHDSSFRRDLIEKGLRNVEHFQPENIASQYAALYREMVTI